VSLIQFLSYALIATSTDYDSWRPHEASVTAAEVIKILHQNASTSRHVAAFVLARLFEALEDPNSGIGNEEQGTMAFSIMRKPSEPEDVEKLRFILPEYVD
jgi:5'-methylthioadenosine phosphorylase